MFEITEYPQVTAIMCTYGRFKCVERALNCFLAQTYPNKRIIIYNTDSESPYKNDIIGIGEHRVEIWNNNIDFKTREPYTNVGAIRRDALSIVGDYSGGYVVTWDDDDIFLPHFMTQAIERIQSTGLPSFKPEKSFFYSGNNLRLVMNTMEASVVASIEKVREYGYLLETGKEGLGWYTKMRDNKELDEHDTYYIPSYCFNWNDGDVMDAPHKQSGDIDNPDNFENHKKSSKDSVNGRKLRVWSDDELAWCFKPYFEFIKTNKEMFPQDLITKYYPEL